MNESAADFWSATVNAHAYGGLQDLSLGRYLLSLLVVLAVVLLLAWLARKAGWFRNLAQPQKPQANDAEDHLVFYSQFNGEQTLMVVQQGQTVYCYIMKGRQIQLATPLPGLKAVAAQPAAGPSKPPWGQGKTFQALWMQALGGKRGKR
jgi:flagellar biogenesis protein FliO